MQKNRKEKTPSHLYFVRLNEEDNLKFQCLYDKSGAKNKSEFIRARLFESPFKVITIDKSTVDFCNKLTEVNAQIRKMGVLYNQTVRAINSFHSAKVAHTLLEKLECYTIRLQELTEISVALAEEIRGRWSQK